jgi:hypothetical protein
MILKEHLVAFSETALGRFLQAMELYILIVHMMISRFYDASGSPYSQGTDDPTFNGLPVTLRRGSTFRIQPPTVSTPSVGTALDMQTRVQPELRPGRPSIVSRNSSASRISAWMTINTTKVTARFRSVDDQEDRERLRTADEAEKGVAISPIKENRSSYGSPMEPKESAKWRDPVYTSVLYESPPEMSNLADVQLFTEPPMNRASVAESDELDPELDADRRASRIGAAMFGAGGAANFLSISPSPVPKADFLSISPSPDPATTDSATPEQGESQMHSDPRDSAVVVPDIRVPTLLDTNTERRSIDTPTPIYGMNGPLPLLRTSMDGPRTTISASIYSPRSSAGVESLFRHQEELDKSIAQLRLFGTKSDSDEGRTSSRSKAESEVPSTFSLSNFPDPPWEKRVEAASELDGPTAEAEGDDLEARKRQSIPSIASEEALPPPRMPILEAEHKRQLSDMPLDTRESLADECPPTSRSPKFDSQGTQYDVTSFIGSKLAFH